MLSISRGSWGCVEQFRTIDGIVPDALGAIPYPRVVFDSNCRRPVASGKAPMTLINKNALRPGKRPGRVYSAVVIFRARR
jgi:hypothetical protein